MSFSVAAVRRQFPILSEIIDGQPVHYLDNGASAQTPDAVLALPGLGAELDHRHTQLAAHRREPLEKLGRLDGLYARRRALQRSRRIGQRG